MFHDPHTVTEHREQLRQRNQNLEPCEDLQPVQSLHLDLCCGLLESDCDEVVHGFGIEAERVEDLAENDFQLGKLLLRDVVGDRFHPVRHDSLPDVLRDDFVGNETDQSLQTFLQVLSPRSQSVPVSADSRVLGRMRQETRDENFVVRDCNFLEPIADVVDLELLQGALDAAIARVRCDVEPVEQHVEESSEDLNGGVDCRCAPTNKQPNAVSSELLSVF